MDSITNYMYKLVLMIVTFCETYNSDLINVPAQNVSYEIYAGNILINEEYIDCQTVESAIQSENATRNACIDHTSAEEPRSQDGKSHIT